MSRIGKKPVNIKDVQVKQDGQKLSIKGKLGEHELNVHPNMEVLIEGEELLVKRPNDVKENRALHGLTRALIQNIVTGVTEGFSKKLEIVGVGYRVEAKGSNILLNLGYSHPIYFMPPEGITIDVPGQTQMEIKGSDKELVGLVAAKIRSFRPPEPYKGKGIKYSDEIIIKKAGKTAGS